MLFNSPDATPANQSGYIQIRSNVNGVDYYFTYYHIRPTSSLTVGDEVFVDTIIGQVQVDCNVDITPTHVHITCRSSNGLIKKLFPFFRTVSQYNFGSDMDYLSGDHFDGNMFYIYAYTKSVRGATDPYGYVFDFSKVLNILNNTGGIADNITQVIIIMLQ